MVRTRARYLLAMGLVPSFAAGVTACRDSASPEPSASPPDAAPLQESGPTNGSPSTSVDAAPRPLAQPAIERHDAGNGMWTLHVIDDSLEAAMPRATCPSGKFCVHAPARDAGKMAPEPHRDCPATVRAMYSQSTFEADLTTRERALTPDACCYGWFEPCPGGRPLRSDTTALVADVIARDGWSVHQEHEAARAPLDPRTRARLAAHWRAEAAAEHASIASFSRFSLQLLALAAPRDLVTASHEAALDEVRHAEHCFRLASRYAGEDLGPGPLTLPSGDVPVAPEVVALETLRDGCLGESLAAACVAEAASVTRDPEIAATLSAIARDEEAHAELAWRVVAWLLVRHGTPVANAIRTFLAELAVAELAAASDKPDLDDTDPPAPSDEAHGVLGRATRLAVQRQALREIVVPCAEALLSHARQTAHLSGCGTRTKSLPAE